MTLPAGDASAMKIADCVRLILAVYQWGPEAGGPLALEEATARNEALDTLWTSLSDQERLEVDRQTIPHIPADELDNLTDIVDRSVRAGGPPRERLMRDVPRRFVDGYMQTMEKAERLLQEGSKDLAPVLADLRAQWAALPLQGRDEVRQIYVDRLSSERQARLDIWNYPVGLEVFPPSLVQDPQETT